MDKNERDPILDRLEEIEGKLNSALLRISQLEETKTQEAQVIPPPIIAPAPAEAPWSSHQSRESAETSEQENYRDENSASHFEHR